MYIERSCQRAQDNKDVMREVKSVILSAGKGSRMKSDVPKALYQVNGKPMVQCVADACKGAGIKSIYVVVGSDSDLVEQALGSGYHYVLQEQQSGTGNALMTVRPLLAEFRGDILVLVGDTPFITSKILHDLITRHRDGNADATFITSTYKHTPPYGRVVRNRSGRIAKIVEEADASLRIKKIKEVITSQYCFKAEIVLPLLSKIDNNNAKSEYNLTDIIGILTDTDHKVEALKVAEGHLVFGINSVEDIENRLNYSESLS